MNIGNTKYWIAISDWRLANKEKRRAISEEGKGNSEEKHPNTRTPEYPQLATRNPQLEHPNMTEKSFTTKFQEFKDLKELPISIQELMQKAFEARDKAYAPYSNFQVGAAILLENGEMITGSNQENASYPSGLCAERTAIFYAGAKFPDQKIKSIAISAKSLERTIESPVSPCGGCRQAILEYETKQASPISIYFMGETGRIIKTGSVADLLPLKFPWELGNIIMAKKYFHLFIIF